MGQLGITEEEDLCKLAGAALLHDIGKMEVDEELLNKPKSLSEEQKERIQQHPEVGLQMVADTDLDEASRAVISQHHERMDGTGYPNGLKGDEIHEWARLCAIVDSFDAMISQVPSRPVVSVVEALRRLEDGTGALYDETMIGEFVALVRERSDDDALAESSDNRRRHERRHVSVEALAQVIDQENPAFSSPPFSINTVDMSRSGICFTHSDKVEPGKVIRIWIETGNGQRTLDAIIVRCSPKKGGFTYGARFDFHFDADGNPTVPIISTKRSTEEPLDTESAEPAGEEAGAAEADAQPADLEDNAPAEEVASNE